MFPATRRSNLEYPHIAPHSHQFNTKNKMTATMADTPQDYIKHTSEPKKRKRNRKAQPDKKFECQHEGCGKSYSRAEHLHRHQLNRTDDSVCR